MSYTETALKVIAKVSGRHLESIRPDMDLVANLGLDSAKALELLVALEDNLCIEITDEEAARLNTVGDVLDYLGRLETVSG
jgi:acyl carrier protein